MISPSALHHVVFEKLKDEFGVRFVKSSLFGSLLQQDNASCSRDFDLHICLDGPPANGLITRLRKTFKIVERIASQNGVECFHGPVLEFSQETDLINPVLRKQIESGHVLLNQAKNEFIQPCRFPVHNLTVLAREHLHLMRMSLLCPDESPDKIHQEEYVTRFHGIVCLKLICQFKYPNSDLGNNSVVQQLVQLDQSYDNLESYVALTGLLQEFAERVRFHCSLAKILIGLANSAEGRESVTA